MGVIDDLTDDEKEIWHTYMCRSRKLTRQSVISIGKSVNLKAIETDDNLECCNSSKQADFYDSINSIIFSIFTTEFRINIAANKRCIYNKKLTKFFDTNDVEIKPHEDKARLFSDLSLYSKWRTFPFACGVEETEQYLKSVIKLKKWIELRNDIAHAKYSKLSRKDIIPQEALDCYESVVDAIFELNIVLGYDREEQERNRKEVSLLP